MHFHINDGILCLSDNVGVLKAMKMTETNNNFQLRCLFRSTMRSKGEKKSEKTISIGDARCGELSKVVKLEIWGGTRNG